MIEIGIESFPDIFNMKGLAQEVCKFIFIYQYCSISVVKESVLDAKALFSVCNVDGRQNPSFASEFTF